MFRILCETWDSTVASPNGFPLQKCGRATLERRVKRKKYCHSEPGASRVMNLLFRWREDCLLFCSCGDSRLGCPADRSSVPSDPSFPPRALSC